MNEQSEAGGNFPICFLRIDPWQNGDDLIRMRRKAGDRDVEDL